MLLVNGKNLLQLNVNHNQIIDIIKEKNVTFLEFISVNVFFSYSSFEPFLKYLEPF